MLFDVKRGTQGLFLRDTCNDRWFVFLSETKQFGPELDFLSSPGTTADLSLPELIHLKHMRYKMVPLQTLQRPLEWTKCIKDQEESILIMQDPLQRFILHLTIQIHT